MKTTVVLIAVILAVVAVYSDDGPRLVLTARPEHGLTPLHVHLRAEIVGELDETQHAWLCPKVEWEMPDLTHPSEGPETCGEEPRRVWTKDVTIQRIAGEGMYYVTFGVAMYHDEHVLARKTAQVRVLQ